MSPAPGALATTRRYGVEEGEGPFGQADAAGRDGYHVEHHGQRAEHEMGSPRQHVAEDHGGHQVGGDDQRVTSERPTATASKPGRVKHRLSVRNRFCKPAGVRLQAA